MKSNFYKRNPKRILGYFIAFAMVFFNSFDIDAQCIMTASGVAADESCAGACDGSVAANVSGSACITTDTVIPGPHVSNYTSAQTR